ncbi:flagellar hook-basal body protein [Campylobacter fetus subsp. venerealis]|uniref:flagellar hook-basal body protein n=1 Tax=Campylobacter fetus TaxID=196 RepID=UPI0018E8850B|nr:flagellar hook-basal body protein [Campylobacter fetus]QQF52980.1 flagellar hook-basal body protein [Campylobacter fetus subsp. venerealis]
MQNGYYQATGAMVTQFNRLDVITNNLANVNTIGYKRDDVVIADFERIFKETRDILPLENHTRDAAKFLNRTIDRVPQINEIYTDFNVGGLKMTNNPLDVAIGKSDLFLLVDTPNGVRLTKNGALNLDNEGYIVTKEGYRVLPNNYENQPEEVRGIQIPQDAPVAIDKDGNIYSNNENVGRFFIAQPREIRNLQKEGDNLFILPNLNELNDVENSGSVAQGYSQISNVNPVIEMVNLVETNRLVDMYQRVMSTHMNDINQEAITKLASPKV